MQVTFDDVVGLDEEIVELKTLIEILKHPNKYQTKGISVPKGMIMHGEAGTGKTLMARALSNETNLPFYLIGSDKYHFEDRSEAISSLEAVFKKAEETAPSIIFIDELDSFLECGRFGEHNYALLNQMLRLMDGFYQNKDIFVLAATNQIQLLPKPLLRPGRFDRKLYFPLGNKATRINAIHQFMPGNTFENDKVLDRTANLLSGMTMAEIKYLCNEVLIEMMKNNAKSIKENYFIDALDRYYLGISKENSLGKEDLYRLAIHETGHAIVNYVLGNGENLFRLSIVKKNASSGHVITVEETLEKHLLKTDILNKIKTALAGYAAEMVFFDEPTAGSENDLAQATRLAALMVEKLGMSSFGIRQAYYKEQYDITVLSNDYLVKIDNAISEIIDECYDEVLVHIKKNRVRIESIAKALVVKKVISKEELCELIKT